MSEAWMKVACEIGNVIRAAVDLHPELFPLNSSYGNFAKKHGIQQKAADAPVIDQLVNIINRQAEEIAALEYRVKTLMRP